MWREYIDCNVLDVDDAIINRIAGRGLQPGDPGYYRFRREILPHAPEKYLEISPEEEFLIKETVPQTPQLPQIEEYEEALRQRIPQETAEEILMQNISKLRSNLRDVEKAKQVLSLWITRFEDVWNLITSLRKMMDEGRDNLERLINVNIAKAKHSLDGIYNTMRTAEVTVVNHRNLLWRIDGVLDRVGVVFGKEWTTQLTEEEARTIAVPFKSSTIQESARLFTKVEFINDWLAQSERERVYTNIKEAARSAWKRYQKSVQLVGPWLIRHEGYRYAYQGEELLESLNYEFNDLFEAIRPLEEENDMMEAVVYDVEKDLEYISSLSKVATKYNVFSPDEWKRHAGIDLEDDLVFLEGGAPTVEPVGPTVAPPVTKEEPVLRPLPIDEDEFLRVRFPDITRFPTSIWGKIQLAGTRLHKINITYTKVTPPEEGVTKTYVVHPYSFRIKRPRRTGNSPVWYLFAEDDRDRHIKAFIYRRIQNIEILPETFDPTWEVEFRYAG